MFEYKVRARHKLGWKEFTFYATTDIEEFLNRKGIEYVRNATDTIENRQYKEIERLKSNEKTPEDLVDKEQKKNKKAIEYINEHKRKDEFLNLNEWQTRDLLEILKGDDKE